jgi:hypothetical protein
MTGESRMETQPQRADGATRSFEGSRGAHPLYSDAALIFLVGTAAELAVAATLIGSAGLSGSKGW